MSKSHEHIKSHAEKLSTDGDEMAWMMMISFLNRHYTGSLEDRKSALKQIGQNLPEGSDAFNRVMKLGEELITHQTEVLPRLHGLADANKNMSELYARYDELMRKRFKLTGTMAVDLEELKQEMERRKRAFKEGR